MRQSFVLSHFRRRGHVHQSFHIKNHIHQDITWLWKNCSRCLLRKRVKKTKKLYKRNRFLRVFINFVKLASNRFVNETLIQLCSRKNHSKEIWIQYERECAFRWYRCLNKLKSLIISNLLINQTLHRSKRSNSIFSSIVSIRHFEFVFQSIKSQKFLKMRSMQY